MKRGTNKRSLRPASSNAARIAPLRVSKAALRRFGALLIWGAVLGGAAYGLYALEPLARSLQGNRGCELRWVELPAWLANEPNADVLAEISAAAGLRATDDIYAPDLCTRVAAGLAACPWVAEVQRVTKQADGVVLVQALFRRPLAMVAKDSTAFVVDEAGFRLPRQVRTTDAQNYHFLVITGARGAAPPIGQRWTGDDLAPGLKLVQFLEQAAATGRAPVRTVLRGVDVSNVGRRVNARDGELRLITIHPQSYIHWGLPPGLEYDIESSAAQKLDWINAIYARAGTWPDSGPHDVRDHDRVLVGEPQ